MGRCHLVRNEQTQNVSKLASLYDGRHFNFSGAKFSFHFYLYWFVCPHPGIYVDRHLSRDNSKCCGCGNLYAVRTFCSSKLLLDFLQKKYLKLINQYSPKGGKLYIGYFIGSSALFILPLIIAKLLF